MRVARYIFTAILAVMLPACAAAQAGMTGDLTVRSEPQGALVKLSGGSIVSGVAPARFRHLLVGEYELTLKKHGFETYKTKIELDPTRQMEMDIRLAPKTRFKTAVRSLFIPGWGQRYADKTAKGWAFTGLTILAGVGYLAADDEYDYRYENFAELRDEYDSLAAIGDLEELRRVHPDLVLAQEKAYDAETVRRVVIGVGVGIWALNVIDALFFFPERRGTFTVKGLSVAPSADAESVNLALSVKF